MSKKNTLTYEVINKDSGTPEIKVYGYIGTWDEVDYNRFQDTFRNLVKDNKNLTMRLHCGGGSVIEGFAIYDLIRGSQCKVHCIVEGMAASMGSVLALSGDTIEMTENAFFMMHAVTAGAWGDKNALDSTRDLIEKSETRLKAIYKERTTAEEATINDWFNNGKDNWLDAQECLKIKLCDRIITPTKKRKLENITALAAKTPMEAWEALNAVEEPTNIQNKNTTIMKQNLVTAMVAAGFCKELTANSGDVEVQNAFTEVIAKAQKAEQYKTELENMKKENATTLVEAAIKAGKIFANEKDEWIRNATDNFTMTSKALERMVGKPNPNNGLNRETPKTPEDPDQPEMMKGREDWTFDKWQTEDPKGLGKLEELHPEAFEKLFNQKFNR